MDDKKIVKKLKELIKEGQKLEKKLTRSSSGGVSVERHNKPHYRDGERWKGKCLNILSLRFGAKSRFFLNYAQKINEEAYYAGDYSKDNVGKALGALEWVTDALENGLTEDLFYQREILLFSDLLNQAYEFLKKDHRYAAAMYGRIVLETTIKELASKYQIKEDSFEQTVIKLRLSEVIHKPFENSLKSKYEIGSWAAHGDVKFKSVSDKEIKEYLDYIRDRVLTLR